ncbi:radical SAM protein [Candidatus Omnitrophota bacterium]
MKKTAFKPEEIIFSPTDQCNLRCAHCNTEQKGRKLPKKTALRFLAACEKSGVKRVGFTGGEPFYALDFLCRISKETVRREMFFDHIITNASWFKSKKELRSALNRLFGSGYDGRFFVSVDAFHGQDLRKVAAFIRAARQIWERPDIVSIASIKGTRENETRTKLKRLAGLLKARFRGLTSHEACIKNEDLLLNIFTFNLSPVGKASGLRDHWDGKWFKDDFCKGPGHIFFVLPDHTVKPCCGYAHEADILTIGSIKKDSPKRLLRNAGKNRFISAIFGSGLHAIRKELESSGVRFPGKTTNHCFFCHYLTQHIPRPLLDRCLSTLHKKSSGPPKARLYRRRPRQD